MHHRMTVENECAPKTWKSWLWWLPLLLGAVPVWIAITHARWLPTGDLAHLVAFPIIRHLKGESLLHLFLEGSGDAHYGFIVLLHYLNVKLTHWNMRVDALIVVSLAVASALCFLELLRRDGLNSSWRGWVCGFLGVALMLSPQQFENWLASIQTCYFFVVFSMFAVLLLWQIPSSLIKRTVAASIIATCASFTFTNGFLTWAVAASLIFFEAADGDQRKMKRKAWVVFAILAMICAGLWLQDYKWRNSSADSRPLHLRLISDPWAFIKFFFQVLGLPHGKGWFGLGKAEMSAVQDYSSLVTGALTVFAFFILVVKGCVNGGMAWARAERIWVILGSWGLLNGAMISLGRTGVAWSNAQEDRYAAFTIPLTLGVLVLMSKNKSRTWRGGFVLALLITTYGWVIGALYGLDVLPYYNLSLNKTTTAVMFRKVAPVPGWKQLPGIIGDEVGSQDEHYVDIMDQQGWIKLPTIVSPLVKDAPLKTFSFARGEILTCDYEKGTRLMVEAWAMDNKSTEAVDALVISSEISGMPEKWLGVCMKSFRSPKINRQAKPKRMDARIGWQFILDADADVTVKDRLQVLAQAAPGSVTLRAYAIKFDTLEKSLIGSCTLAEKP